MACYKPLSAWQLENGEIKFAERGNIKRELTLPCGQCIGCRLERSRQWAVRCMHEAKMHRHNCFVTLTYDDKHLPQKFFTGKYRNDGTPAYGGNLQYRDVQLFLKRLRKALGRTAVSKNRASGILFDTRSYGAMPHTPVQNSETVLTSTTHCAIVSPSTLSNEDEAGLDDRQATSGTRDRYVSSSSRGVQTREKGRAHPPALRFYMAGEYGAHYKRPHYHLCIFGLEFQDKKYLYQTPSASKIYRSETLEKLWPLGFSSIGELNFESAAYVARYVMKKITGQRADAHYQQVDLETGEIITLTPEFNRMSRRQGIGLAWLQKYQTDVYPHDRVIVRGIETKPPRYYDKKYAASNPTEWEAIEYDRYIESRDTAADQLPHRLEAKERVAQAKLKMLKRKL